MTNQKLKLAVQDAINSHLQYKKQQIEKGLNLWGVSSNMSRLTKNNRLQVQLTDANNKRIETYYLDGILFLSFVEDKIPQIKDGKIGVAVNTEFYKKQTKDASLN